MILQSIRSDKALNEEINQGRIKNTLILVRFATRRAILPSCAKEGIFRSNIGKLESQSFTSQMSIDK